MKVKDWCVREHDWGTTTYYGWEICKTCRKATKDKERA